MSKQIRYPINQKTLGDYYEMTWRCAKCGYCRNVFPSDTEHERFGRQCPSGDRFKYEAYYASGRSEIARRVIEKKQGLSERLRHILYTCTTCGACEEWCQATQWREPLKLEYAMKRHYVMEGGELLPQHKQIIKYIDKHHNRLGRNNRDRLQWLKNIHESWGEKSDIVYFVGCRSSFNRTEISFNTYDLLTKKLGIQIAFLADEHCCGRPLLDIGDEDKAIKLMQHNIEQIKTTGAKRVVFSCAECFHTFSNLQEFGISSDFECVHLSQLLAEHLQRGHFVKPLRRKVTFHDPCYLGRHQGVYDEPRYILSQIPGLELIEMPRNRKNAWCCGAGGGVQDAFPEYSQWIARERFTEALHIHADIVVTACPGCKENLLGIASKHSIKTIDIAELINSLLSEV